MGAGGSAGGGVTSPLHYLILPYLALPYLTLPYQVSRLLDDLETRLNASLISSSDLKARLEQGAAMSKAEVSALTSEFDASDAALLQNVSREQGAIAALETERGRLRAFAPDSADRSASKLWGNVSGHLTAAAADMSQLLAEHRANLSEIVGRLAGEGAIMRRRKRKRARERRRRRERKRRRKSMSKSKSKSKKR